MHIRTDTYKLSPNKAQRMKLAATLDTCRELYNCALEQRKMQRIGRFEQSRQLPQMNANFPEYKAVYSHVLQNVIRRLDRSYKWFFRRVKNGEKPGYPRFKGRNRYDSFEFNNVGFKLNGGMLAVSRR